LNKSGKNLETQDGFTLLELILVLFFMGLIAGLVTPFVASTLDRVKFQSEVREIKSALGYARSQAITLKTLFTFHGDIINSQYWLTIPRDEETTRKKHLDETVKFAEYVLNNESVDDGIFLVHFYPRGNSSGGTIRVEPSNQEKPEAYYEISIDPITGSAKIQQKTF
jgi:Tfp pilus assembly protein FimT